MYTTILSEGQHLSNIASSDNRENYKKILTVMRYMRANIQNKSGPKMKEAAATYLGVTNFNQNTKILPYSRNRPEGRTSTQQKKSGVKSKTIGSIKHCDFCRDQGHNKATCPNVKLKGN